VLVKPFEPQMVISRVRDLLAGKRPEPPARPAVAPARADAPAADKAGSSLEDYFDRLDAALASKAATPPPAPEPTPAAGGRIKVSQVPAMAPAPPRAEHAAGPRPVPVSAPPPAPPPPPPAPRQDEAMPETRLQDAFAALLAAEQAPVAFDRVEAIPEPVIDEIVRRVIARMGDDTMRAAVLDAAERLVREEITRIKAQN
jgi:hypothetical protein